MGILDRWTKNKDAEKLKKNAVKTDEKKSVPSGVVASEKDAKVQKNETEAVKPAKNKTEDKKVEVKKVEVAAGSISHKVLIRPLITEKAAIMESNNKYNFLVAAWADKKQIMAAVEELYGTKPERVNVINVQGKVMRFGRSMGRRSDFKKAIVTLPSGKTINLHEGV